MVLRRLWGAAGENEIFKHGMICRVSDPHMASAMKNRHLNTYGNRKKTLDAHPVTVFGCYRCFTVFDQILAVVYW